MYDLMGMSFERMVTLFASVATRSGNAHDRAAKVFCGLYRNRAARVRDIDGLAKDFVAQLESRAFISNFESTEVCASADGTTKLRHTLKDHAQIETVWIPEPWGQTVCVSSQVGCAMGCTFCHTASMNLLRNLTSAEIVTQVLRVPAAFDARATTNVVFMGMGEPLHNYDAVMEAAGVLTEMNGLGFSHNRVTLSTVGLVPQMERMAREERFNLCVSLHAANDDLRSQIVPSNRRFPLSQVVAACRAFSARKLMFTYVVLPGVNDSRSDADELSRLLADVPSKRVNIIPFNPFPGSPYRRPTDDEVERFQSLLHQRGFRALLRNTRGADVLSACGQLAVKVSPTDGKKLLASARQQRAAAQTPRQVLGD